MDRYVDISFDCLPLRSVARFDLPMDASPKFLALCERIKRAAEKHGLHNSYYLHNAQCVYHLTNSPEVGTLDFRVEGTVLTDAEDQKAHHADLDVQLCGETCDWLTEQVVAWFRETVCRAMLLEFDRFAAAGDLQRTVARMERLQAQMEAKGGFMGMGL